MDSGLVKNAAARSAAFLAQGDRYRLGSLLTEQPHPVTLHLGKIARRDLVQGCRMLLEVDRDVIRRFAGEISHPRLWEISEAVYHSLRDGRRVFMTGCGSTGRLAILLTAMWRHYWQSAARQMPLDPALAADMEQRVVPVMAGGDYALIRAVEGFEDHTEFGRKQLREWGVQPGDWVLAITEGGETPFVIGTAWAALEVGARPLFIYNNPDEILRTYVERSRAVLDEPRIGKWNLTTGPMAITGSTRMQATSMQLATLTTMFELVLDRLLTQLIDRSGPSARAMSNRCQDTLRALADAHAMLVGPATEKLAQWAAIESEVYAAGHKVNYYAASLAADVLTDTTERSPTFCVPPFRKYDDRNAAESWAFLYVPAPDSATAWHYVCKRRPRCLHWTEQDIRPLVPPHRWSAVVETLRRITYEELLRFRIGEDGLIDRPLRRGDAAIVVAGPADLPLLTADHGFLRQRLWQAREAGARTVLIVVGNPETGQSRNALGSDRFWSKTELIHVPLEPTDLRLQGPLHVAVKMILNTVSTATMARLGRILDNVMAWVVPSNGKLIDRATRYIAQLTGLRYEDANRLLFEALEHVEPRLRADQLHPPVVGLAVLRHRDQVDWPEAERRLWTESARVLARCSSPACSSEGATKSRPEDGDSGPA